MRRLSLPTSMASVLVVLSLAYAGCTQGDSLSANADVASVTLSPKVIALTPGRTAQLSGRAFDSEGSQVSAALAWASELEGVATVSRSGLVTAVSVGNTAISATAGQLTDVAIVTVALAPVATIAIAPQNPSVTVNQTLQLTAALRDSSGTALTGRVVIWETSVPGIATVSGEGLVRGVAAGTVAITARSEGQSATTTVSVLPAPVATVAISPASPAVAVGGAVQLQPLLRDATGAELTGRVVTWETHAGGIATVSSAGLVTGVAVGSATITARSEGRAGSTVVTVQATIAPVASITLSPTTATINVNGTQQITPTLRDAQGTVITGRTVTWESSALTTATVSASGLVHAVASGTTTITARSEGQSAQASVTVQPAPVATVTISPASPAVVVAATVQLEAALRDAGGSLLTGRTTTWESSAVGTATVSATGLVRGIAAGTATITARSEGQAGTTVVTVTAAPVAGANADPTLLPRATGQRPAAGTYGRSLGAGRTYVDPNSGVTVLKLTDAQTPAANAGMYHGYSEGGPIISQPWTGTDGDVYYTVKAGAWLVDVNYRTLTTTNWRRVESDSEIGFAFSLNPATPRIAYTITDWGAKRVERYNTATNRIENIGHWPWIPSASGQYLTWLQNNLNDEWFVGMLNSNHTVVAFRPSDGFQRTITGAAAGVTIDEPHIDREYPYVYLSAEHGDTQNKIVNLATGAYTIPVDPTGVNGDDHASPIRGKIVAISWMANGVISVDYHGNVKVAVTPSPTDWGGDWHQAGQWVFNNPNEYFAIDQFARNGNFPIYNGMMGFVSTNGDLRLIAATDGTGGGYDTGGQPHMTLAPDGKFLMWVSNMNGSGRHDLFLARLPVR